MKTLTERPREVRALFNPAFCGLVIARGIEGFSTVSGRPIPFSLSLLILPLSLHQPTRVVFKAGNRSYFTKILEDHPEIRVNFAERTKGLFPYTMEAFAYLAHCGATEIDEAGAISLVRGRVRKTVSGTQDSKDCQNVARSLGRKFAQIGDRVTVYTSLGISP
jgi:hypothetical protein